MCNNSGSPSVAVQGGGEPANNCGDKHGWAVIRAGGEGIQKVQGKIHFIEGMGKKEGLGDEADSDDISQMGDTGCSTSFEEVQVVVMGGNRVEKVRDCISFI